MTGDIRHWAITDGRVAVGVVDLADDGAYVTRDLTGNEVGRFDLAARVFELTESKQ